MEKISRQDYNKKYYKENKDRLAEQLYKKVECDGCGRSVNFQNLNKHKKSVLCKNRSNHVESKIDIVAKILKIENDLNNLLEMKNDIEKLTASL